ncbi:MAG: NADH:ubiquinone oxidoreductase subunit [Candidatus Deianiraeaceae bacterium]|jgi:NADH:ubiquinone oxidoreductase subunit
MFRILQFLTRFKLIFTGKLIGSDEYQNKYYELKRKDSFGRNKRICIFNGIVEASKIPSHWHSWMHHTTNEPIKYKHLFWMKSHIPNLTGTLHAFYPNKHTQFNVYGKSHINPIQDYTAWNGIISEE